MYSLTPATCARLRRLPKQPAVWEGDRLPISEGMLDAFGYESFGEFETEEASDCILWVDGTEGMLRAVTIVPADTGHEAVVRTLLQAMEHPQGAIPPARPQKIVVRDREIHFFLRGALRDLDIAIDHADSLPIITEIFESLQQLEPVEEVSLPEGWEQVLNAQALRIWENAPWRYLSDDHILQIDLNHWDLDSLYVSVLGMAGLEYGLLIYRSLDSLIQFRKMATMDRLTPRQMQQAFLSQDCLFLNFDLLHDEPMNFKMVSSWIQAAATEVTPEFGSLHPLEGLRTALEVQEAAMLRVCLETLNAFFEKYGRSLKSSRFPLLSESLSLRDPISDRPLPITVKTCPEITAHIAQAEGHTEDAASIYLPRFRDDYVPEGALIFLTDFSKERLAQVQQFVPYHVAGKAPYRKTPLPVIIIQTSRPKAQKLANHLIEAGGVQTLCFNQGGDPMTGEILDLGLIQTGDLDFHLFVEYSRQNAQDRQALERWYTAIAKSKGACGLLVASGVTGAARGCPSTKESIAFFEAKFKTPEELRIPPLQMHYSVEWE